MMNERTAAVHVRADPRTLLALRPSARPHLGPAPGCGPGLTQREWLAPTPVATP